MAEFRDLNSEEQLTGCLTCGAAVFDQGLHIRWHHRLGDPQGLSHLGGHNDPGPMPERD